MKKAFNVKVTYEAVRQLIRATKKSISHREPLSTIWHADETYIRIKGKGHWLWIVYCADTGKVLAWHISDKHLFCHAKRVITDALNVAGVRPIKIITDGLWQYPAAIKKVIWWNWNEQKERRIIDSGIGKPGV